MGAVSPAGRAVLVGGLLLMVLSCATDLPLAPERPEAALPGDASAYFAMRTGRLEGLIDDIVRSFELETGEIADILQDSERVVAALGSEEERDAFSAVASGAYPAGRMRFGLTMSRRWRRQSVETGISSRPFFEEREGLGEIAVPSGAFVLFSNGSMRTMVERAALGDPPSDAVELDPEAELSMLLPEIGDAIRSSLPRQARGLPLESLSVNVRHDAEADTARPFEVYGAIEFGDERAARVFSVVARLVIGALAEGVPVSELKVEREADTIVYEGLPADEDQLREWAAGFLGTLRDNEPEEDV